MTLPVWVDGRVVAAERATTSALDLGLRSGVGVFETLRVRAGRTFRRSRHLERACAGATGLGFELDRDGLDRAIDELLAAVAAEDDGAPGTRGDLVVRLTATAGPIDADAPFPPPALGRPTVVVSAHPAPALPLAPVRAITVTGGRRPADIKSTSYAWSHRATMAARAAGADLALLVEGEQVLEAAAGNVLVVAGDVLVAPAHDGRALTGVTAEAILGLVRGGAVPGLTAVERTVERPELLDADAVLVTSSVAGLVDVIEVDGEVVGLGRGSRALVAGAAEVGGGPGAQHVERLRAAFDELVAEEADPPGEEADPPGTTGPRH
jgi:branched-subunit amino acid aminotransferase/4-amino-4-deoxychorismate lyase